MNQSSDNLEAFFKLCKKHKCMVVDCIVHNDSIINSSVTVVHWDIEYPLKYKNKVKVDTVLVREGRLDEVEELLVGCVIEATFE